MPKNEHCPKMNKKSMLESFRAHNSISNEQCNLFCRHSLDKDVSVWDSINHPLINWGPGGMKNDLREEPMISCNILWK